MNQKMMRKPKSKLYIKNLQSLVKTPESVTGFKRQHQSGCNDFARPKRGTCFPFGLVDCKALKSNTMFRGYQFEIELKKKAFITHLPADMNY